MFNRKLALALVVILSLVFSGVALANTPSSPTSDGGVVPYIVDNPGPGDNVTSEQLGYEFSSDRVNYVGGVEPWEVEDAEGNKTYFANYPYPNITVEVTDETYVAWTSTFGIGAVIVKGGNDANVYEYVPQAYGDTGLASPPVGAQQNPAGLSNLTFCWNPEDVEECWEEETAWAAGTRYSTERGQWATFTSYPTEPVILYAGQTMNAGTVSFSDVVAGKVTITITLNAGWRFNPEEEENVKIQDYATAPSGNPAPGGFAHKAYATSSPFTIEVPANNFYGVHVDVEYEVECPVP